MTRRVLIIVSEFPPSPGGIGNHALNLANMLSRDGLEVIVLTDLVGASTKETRDFDSALDYQVVRTARVFPLYYVARLWNAAYLLWKKRPGTIIASGRFSLWVGALVSLLYKGRSIAVLHGSEVIPSNYLFRVLTHRCLQYFDMLVAVSKFTRSMIPAHLGQKPVRVISNGIDLLEFENIQPAGKLEGNPALVTVGNLTQRKGQHRVVSALPVLKKRFPELRYHMIGLPTNKDEIVKQAEGLGVLQDIVIHGKIGDRKKMFQILSDADVFVMLSDKAPDGSVEGYGIAILEANALGIPAIGARGCGIEDAILEGHNGLLIDGNDSSAFLKALEAIIGDHSSYSVRARQWAQNHTWTETGRAYRALLNGV